MSQLWDDRKEIGTRPQHIQAITKEVLEELFHKDKRTINYRDPKVYWCYWTEDKSDRKIEIEINGNLQLDETQQIKAVILIGETNIPEALQSDRVAENFRYMGVQTGVVIRFVGQNKSPTERVAADTLYLLRSHMLNIESAYHLDKFVALKMTSPRRFTEQESGDINTYFCDIQLKVEYQLVNGPPNQLYKQQTTTTSESTTTTTTSV